jgi:hypothetical protein
MSSPKKIDLKRDFAIGAYQRLKTGDTVSHVGIFDPALWTVASLTFSLVQLSLPPPLSVWISLCTRIQCLRGGGVFGVLDLRQINTCRKVPLKINNLDDDILHCLLLVLSFYEGKERGHRGKKILVLYWAHPFVLKVHKNENFFGFDFEICTFS